jgi:hypothetical protein
MFAGPREAGFGAGNESAVVVLTVKPADAVLLDESVTCTANPAVPALVGVPVITPAVETLKFSAARLLAPEVTVHV